MKKNEQQKEPILYKDFSNFKGGLFQENVNSINKLYFGQGLKLSDVPFIFKNEKDKKYYLSVNEFEIFSKKENKSQFIYLPENFINQVFYYDGLLFFVSQNYKLLVFKIGKSFCERFFFIPKTKNNENQIQAKNKDVLNLEQKKLDEILNILEGIGKIKELNKVYESLCDLLRNHLNENLNKNTNKFTDSKYYEITIGELELTCTYKKISQEIDSIGQMRSPIRVNDRKVTLKAGIRSLKEYIGFKRNNDKDAIKKYIGNDFKCPILFKNFTDVVIPENKTLLCEIKSGFALQELMDQINTRINIIKNCLFSDDVKPEFFIGIVNVNSKNSEKLEEVLADEPKFDGKVLIITAVDYEYHGFDLSLEVNNEYLLYKKIDNVETKLDEMKKEMNDNFGDLKQLITLVLNQIKEIHPQINIQMDMQKLEKQ